MTVGEFVPTKQIWLLDNVEIIGTVHRIGPDDIGLIPDPGYANLIQWMTGNSPFAWEPLGTPAMMHLETYPLGVDEVNRDEPWSLPKKPDGQAFQVGGRDLQVGDHIRVSGRWVIDHHPDFSLKFPPDMFGEPPRSRMRGLLCVGKTHAELHPFAWDAIQLFEAPKPGEPARGSISLAAPLHTEQYLGGGKWLANEVAGVAGHVFIHEDGSTFRTYVYAHLELDPPPQADPATTLTWTESLTRIDARLNIDQVRTISRRQDGGLIVDAVLNADADASILDPAADRWVFQARYELRWTSGPGTTHAPQGSPVHAVSRSQDKLDIFVTGNDGIMRTAAWEPGFTEWHGWWPINNATAVPGAPVTVVSRAPDKLDVFVVGTDNRVWTAAWEPGFTGWHGWWPIKDLLAPQGSPVHAVSRSQDKLDIFVTGNDGIMRTAAWEPGFTEWHGWWPINNATAVPGAPVTVVSRAPDKLDVFVVGTDNRVWTAAWEPGFTGWHGWWPIKDLLAPQGSPVHAVSRSQDKLDIFVTGNDGIMRTAAWEPGFTEWHGWWPINNATAVPGAPVTVVSRAPDKLDVFVVGTDNRVWTAAWEPGFTGWHGWWPIKDLLAPQGSPVHAVSRSQDKLDIFVTGNDGIMRTAAWEPGFTEWHGWWPIGG